MCGNPNGDSAVFFKGRSSGRATAVRVRTTMPNSGPENSDGFCRKIVAHEVPGLGVESTWGSASLTAKDNRGSVKLYQSFGLIYSYDY